MASMPAVAKQPLSGNGDDAREIMATVRRMRWQLLIRLVMAMLCFVLVGATQTAKRVMADTPEALSRHEIIDAERDMQVQTKVDSLQKAGDDQEARLRQLISDMDKLKGAYSFIQLVLAIVGGAELVQLLIGLSNVFKRWQETAIVRSKIREG